MRIATQNALDLLCVTGLCALATTLLVANTPPRPHADPPPATDIPTSRPTAVADVQSFDESARDPDTLLAIYDAIAVAALNGSATSDRELQAWLQALPGIEVGVEVRTLRDSERLILWQAPPPRIHGGGARASLFVREGTTWRQAGYVDPEAWTSSVWLGGIDAESGIAFIVESYDGNGWPPSRAVALAVAGGSVASVVVDDVPRVEIDGEAGPQPTLHLWRRVPDVNRYPDPPIRGSRWQVRRGQAGLVATESPLTPWIDALAAFCADPRRSDAVPRVRASVERCAGEAALRWASRNRLVVTVSLVLRCDDASVFAEDGELTLERHRNRWRVVASTPCGDAR